MMVDRIHRLLRKYNIEPRHVVHVGAHKAEEMEQYRRAGFGHITLIEPIPELANELKERFAGQTDVTVVNCACSDVRGKLYFYVHSPTNMSSLNPPGPDDVVKKVYDVRVHRLDDLVYHTKQAPNVAVIDAQGHELEVLRGAAFHSLDLVLVETCTVDDPTMASPHGHVVSFMHANGFAEVDRWVRSYDMVNKWARGSHQPFVNGEIRDVVFVRSNLLPTQA